MLTTQIHTLPNGHSIVKSYIYRYRKNLSHCQQNL